MPAVRGGTNDDVSADSTTMQLQSPPAVDAATHESRVRVRMNWTAFETFLEARGDDGGTRITYLDGVLEIMSPSRNHELIKKNLARFLEVWALDFDVSMTGVGSFTIVDADEETGLEPDECYFLGPAREGAPPDLAIEVVWSRPLLDKLESYRRLGVREVWVWEKGVVTPWVLSASGYKRSRKSRLLPELDLSALARHAGQLDQHAALKAWRRAFKRH